MATWELLTLVREVFGAVHEQGDRSARRHIIESTVDHLSAVITFNYDTSLERALERSFCYPKEGTPLVDDFLPIYKLHGSLNWGLSRSPLK